MTRPAPSDALLQVLAQRETHRTRESWRPVSVKMTEKHLALVDLARRVKSGASDTDRWAYFSQGRSEFVREAALSHAREILKQAGWRDDGRGGFKAPKR